MVHLIPVYTVITALASDLPLYYGTFWTLLSQPAPWAPTNDTGCTSQGLFSFFKLNRVMSEFTSRTSTSAIATWDAGCFQKPGNRSGCTSSRACAAVTLCYQVWRSVSVSSLLVMARRRVQPARSLSMYIYALQKELQERPVPGEPPTEYTINLGKDLQVKNAPTTRAELCSTTDVLPAAQVARSRFITGKRTVFATATRPASSGRDGKAASCLSRKVVRVIRLLRACSALALAPPSTRGLHHG